MKIDKVAGFNMSKFIGRKCLVRCDKSGVFYGTVEEVEGQYVRISNARNIRYWDGANRIEQLSVEGTKKPENCQFTVVVKEIELFDLIQLLPCAVEAIKSIEAVKEWKF